MCERSSQLRALHAKGAGAAAAADARRRAAAAAVQPSGKAVAAVLGPLARAGREAAAAQQGADDAVAAAYAAMADPAATAAQASGADELLVVADTGLLAVIASAQQLGSSVAAAEDRLRGTRAAARPAELSVRDLLAHARAALASVAERSGRARLDAAGTRDALGKHRAFVARFARPTLLADDPAEPPAPAPAGPSPGRGSGGKRAMAKRFAATAIKTVAAVNTANASRLTSDVVHLAARTGCKVAGSVAAHSAGGRGAVAGADSAGAVAQRLRAGAARFECDVAALGGGERRELEAQHQELMEEQRRSAAREARQVEASVRELSVLTAIVTEQVALQSEQVGLIGQNTASSKAALQGATRELRQPGKAFWTATRLLVAFIWANTLLLLVLDRLVR